MTLPASPAPADTVGLRIELLGVPRLLRDDAELQRLERRDAALLALLALEGPAARAHVAALVWPDSEPRRAANNLRQRLVRLKRVARQDLVSGDRQLALVADLQHDLRVADERRPEALAVPTELLGTMDYDDCGELAQWVARARTQWRAARRQALADAASRLETDGRLALALELAERLVQEDPVAEHAHRRVMRLHYLRGDRAAALAAFARCGDALRREMKVAPGVETRQLAAMIEASAVVETPARVEPLPPALRRPPRLVGRQDVCAQIERAVARGITVLLEGEPGSGKSRLLNDLAHQHGWPAPAGARPGDEAVPYALAARWLDGLSAGHPLPVEPGVRQELARLVPRLADPGDPPQGMLVPARLVQAVEAALVSWCVGEGPVGLVMDDLQFADAASLDLLLDLPASGERWVWLLACRAGEEPAALRRWREKVDPDDLTLLSLAPLDGAAVEALLESLELPGLDAAAWSAPLRDYCGGHPYALIETLADLHAQGRRDFSGAPSLPAHSALRKGAVMRRLECLPAGARQLAQVAAAAGQDFGVGLAAAAMGCTTVALAGPWGVLEGAGLFRSGGFAHDLVRQAALEGLPQAIERALHREIAAWLARADQSALEVPPAARVAAHWEAAHEWALAAQCHEAAAAEALQRAARREALHALDAAARCHRAAGQPGSDAAAFDCDWRGVPLLLSMESTDAALARAEALLPRAATDAQRAAALEARAHVRAERHENEAALDDAQAAGQLAQSAGMPRLAVLAAQRAAAALMRLSRPEDAVAVLREREAELSHLNDEERLYWLGEYATSLDYLDRRIEAVAMFEQAATQAERLARWNAAADAWGNQSIALMYLNRLQASMAATRRAIACGHRAGNERGNLLIDEMTLAGSLRDLGQYADYLQAAQPLPQALRDVGYAPWAFAAENDLAVCYLWLGRPDLVQQTLTPLPDDTAPIWRATRLFIQARLIGWRASGAQAARSAVLIREALALLVEGGAGGRSYPRLKMALEAARCDEPAAGLAAVRRIEAEALEREQFLLMLHALVLRTELLTRLGAAPEAALAASDLMQRCEREGAPAMTYVPEIWWVAYEALRPTDPAQAGLALQRAWRWIEQIALPQMPALFRSSFLERNPVNAAIRRAMARDASVVPGR